MSLRDDGHAAVAWRRAKVGAHQLLRLADHVRHPQAYPRPLRAQPGQTFAWLHGTSQTQVNREDAAADPLLEVGKRHNLGLAAPAFDSLVLGPDRPLSFWATLGRVTQARGYRHGLELRGGCLLPALGGGLCLLSNALFALGAQLGWTILERHGHTLQAVPPPPDQLWGLDATLFWPYVDLRMAPAQLVQLQCRLQDGALHLAVHGTELPSVRCVLRSQADRTLLEHGDDIRYNQLVRDTFAVDSGALLASEVVAHNRKRMLESVEQARTCLTCGELACKSRQTVPDQRV